MSSMVLHVSLLFFIARASSRHVSSPVLTRQHFQSTSASAPATTAIALLPRDDLARPLTNSLTCGYTSGLWSSAVTCAPEYSCNYYTEPYSAPNFGCCSSGSGCGYVSTCIDYGASNNPNTGGGVMVGDEEFLCGSDYPFCSTLVLFGQEYTASRTYSFYYYSCQVESGGRATAFQMTRGSSATTSSTSSSTSTQDSSPSESITLSATSFATASSASISPAISPLTTVTATEAPSGLSQGAQIGIGVGAGLVGAGALIAASLLLWRRRGTPHAVHEDTYYAHYGGTGDNSRGSLGTNNHGYPNDVLRKQEHESSGPVELTSTSVHHELDGGYTR